MRLLLFIPLTIFLISCSQILTIQGTEALKGQHLEELSLPQHSNPSETPVYLVSDDVSELKQTTTERQSTVDSQQSTVSITENQETLPPVNDIEDVNDDSDDITQEELKDLEPSPLDDITYDVPIDINDSVEAHIKYFQTTVKDRFGKWLARSGRYMPVMKGIFKEKGLPEDLVYLCLIESGFNPYAYSRSHAVGAWQFMKSTGRKYNLRADWWIDERRDPVKSTMAAAEYLQDLYNMFGSWPLAMASYNAGEGRVYRAMLKTKSEDFWELKESRHLRRETKNYVPKFMAATIIAKNPQAYGFDVELEKPLVYDEVEVTVPVDLRVVAKYLNTTYEELKLLNPELRRWTTPPHYKFYTLKIPYGTKELFALNYDQITNGQKTTWDRHLVRKGETLSLIAKKYGTTVEAIREVNRLAKRQTIREGTYLLIPVERNKVQISPALAENKGDRQEIPYRVRRGDSLWKISQEFNVSIQDIKEWNGIEDGELIKAGERLKLYITIPENL